MNKKLNTALFMIGATVFNLVLLFVLIVVFLAAMVGSFLIYNQVVKWIARKIDMEKYFLPLFKRRPKQGG